MPRFQVQSPRAALSGSSGAEGTLKSPLMSQLSGGVTPGHEQRAPRQQSLWQWGPHPGPAPPAPCLSPGEGGGPQSAPHPPAPYGRLSADRPAWARPITSTGPCPAASPQPLRGCTGQVHCGLPPPPVSTTAAHLSSWGPWGSVCSQVTHWPPWPSRAASGLRVCRLQTCTSPRSDLFRQRGQG